MIIILDGPDGTGKTTLAKMLQKKLKAAYLHLTYRWKEKIFDYHTAAIRFAARKNKPIILDRWWPSEAIYAKGYRGGSDWPLQGRMCDRIARKFGAVYVYCLPESVQAAVIHHAELKAKREEMYDDIAVVADLYLKLWNGDSTHPDGGQYIDQVIRSGGLKDRPDCIKYTISEYGHCMDLFVERIIEKARAWRALQWQPVLKYQNWNMLGHAHNSKYLLVGEQVNPKFRELYWPFYEYNHSSLFVTQALHELGLSEDLFMWTNVFNHDGSDNQLIRPLLEYRNSLSGIDNMRVITLGKKAAFAIRDVDIHAELPHPSWVKRFGSVNMVEVFKHAIN